MEQEYREREARRAEQAGEYRRTLKAEPTEAERNVLDGLAEEIGFEAVKADCDLYSREFAEIEKRREALLSGYGQCRGNLVSDGLRIVVCCCERMRERVVKDRVIVRFGSLAIAWGAREKVEQEDGTSYVMDDFAFRGTNSCPFCRAKLFTMGEGRD